MTMRRALPAVRAPRRSRQWGITHANGAIVTATDAGSLLIDLGAGLVSDLGADLVNATVSAIRLQFDLNFQATAVVGDRSVGAWGIIVITQSAFDAGVASIPDPTFEDGDWMAHGTWNVAADVAGAISRPRDGQIVLKNDSMRKMRQANKVLALKFRPTLIDDPISIFVSGRVLFILR